MRLFDWFRKKGQESNEARRAAYETAVEFLKSTFDRYQDNSFTLPSKKDAVVASIRKLGDTTTSERLIPTEEIKALAILEIWRDYGFYTEVIDAAKHALSQIQTTDRLIDQAIVAEIVKTESNRYVRDGVLQWLTDPLLLAEIARFNNNSQLRMKVIGNLTDQTVLAELAETDGDPNIQQIASKRLKHLKQL